MDLHSAVSKTRAYSSFFNFPLTPEEIHFWLITPKTVSSSQIYNFVHPLSKSLAQKRKQLSLDTNRKIAYAKKLSSVLKYVPGLRLLALTGSVAAQNSRPLDDIDLLLITTPHSIWLVRPLVILIISLFFKRRHPYESHNAAANAFCPNLWLDTLSLSVPANKRNLYTAHEVLQIKPLIDKNNTFQAFLQANSWTSQFLANAYSLQRNKKVKVKSDSKLFSLAIPFNTLFYIFQRLYMKPKITTESVGLHYAYLHTVDFETLINSHLYKDSDLSQSL